MENKMLFGNFHSSEELTPAPCYFNLNWDHSPDAASRFDSPLASLVSSPSSSPAPDGLIIHELIGRLGDLSPPPPAIYSGSGAFCYTTPLSSPHKLRPQGLPVPLPPAAHLPPLSADPGFVERAARFSCFAGGLPGPFPLPEAGKLSRASSSQSLKESSASGVNAGQGDSNPRKRKAAPKSKPKETPCKAEEGQPNAKRSKSAEMSETVKESAVKPKAVQNGGGGASSDGGDSGLESNAKPAEPPKQDYIHVRARRGQATDSHSLAERVRREKISERMKLLQDLVPGCNKITGKAIMLDEIINYVQSLQHQVEFLSMKLSEVNPRLDFNMDNFFPKDIQQPHGALPQQVYPIETAAMASLYAHQPQSVVANGFETQCSINLSDANLGRPLCMQLPPLDGFGDVASKLGNFWEDDLQNVVQMVFEQNQEAAFSSHNFHGSLATAHMKIEL